MLSCNLLCSEHRATPRALVGWDTSRNGSLHFVFFSDVCKRSPQGVKLFCTKRARYLTGFFMFLLLLFGLRFLWYPLWGWLFSC